jgi:hypothetical protein
LKLLPKELAKPSTLQLKPKFLELKALLTKLMFHLDMALLIEVGMPEAMLSKMVLNHILTLNHKLLEQLPKTASKKLST